MEVVNCIRMYVNIEDVNLLINYIISVFLGRKLKSLTK